MKGQLKKTAILTLCGAFLVAAGPLAAAGKPKAVPVEPIKDVGTVAKGEKVVHDFVLRNEGDAALEITDVKAACGCTVAEFTRSIPPGQSGKIHTELDTVTFTGPIAKGVSVFTNDPDNPQIELTVRADVQPFISMKPGYARYITVQGEDKEGIIHQTLWAPDSTPFEVVKVESPWPYLDVSFAEAKEAERVADAPGKQWRVRMHLSNQAEVGPLADYVTVHTTHPKQKLVQIPVSGFVRPAIHVTPPVADFGRVEVKEPLRKSLNVRAFSTEAVKVLGVEDDLAALDSSVETIQEGREYQIRLVLKPEIGKGPFTGKLKIRTDSPKTPLIEVELKGTVQ
jgi:hypothetical protein